MLDGGNPYRDQKSQDGWIREFEVTVDDRELIWHLDHLDRIVTVISGDNWFVQLDNSMPVALVPGNSYFIPRETFHRVIKGSNNLLVRIVEPKSEEKEEEHSSSF